MCKEIVLYVNGKKGKDKYSGTDKTLPLKTIARAIEMLEDHREENIKKTIIVDGELNYKSENDDNDFSVFNLRSNNSEIYIKGNGKAILQGDKNHRVLFISGKNTKIHFENIRITGGNADFGAGAYICVFRCT